MSPRLFVKPSRSNNLAYLPAVGSAAIFHDSKTVHTVFAYSLEAAHAERRLSIPKYRKHMASGQAVVTLAGRDHYLGLHGTAISKKEYDRLVGEWMADGRPKVRIEPPAQILIKQIVLGFWKHIKTEYLRENGQPVGTHLKFRPALKLLRLRYRHTRAADFRRKSLKALRATLINKGNSRHYINETMRSILMVFQWAADEEIIDAGVFINLTKVKALKKGKAKELAPVEPVEDSIVKKTLPFMTKVVVDMVRVQELTCARPGEICQMRPCDIDRNEGVWIYRPKDHKTKHLGRDRIIGIGPKAQRILRPYLHRPADQFCFSPIESELQRREEHHKRRKTPPNQGNYPGSSRNIGRSRPAGGRYSNNSYRRAVHRACEIAFGMPDELRKINKKIGGEDLAELRAKAKAWRAEHLWSPNQLRHAAATDIRREFGLDAAQAACGHRFQETTQRYAKPDQTLGIEVAECAG